VFIVTSDSSDRPRVLVTGAAGQVFEGVQSLVRDDCDYVLTDLIAARDDIRALDLMSFPAVLEAMDGIDIVLHLAIYTRASDLSLTPHEINCRRVATNVMTTQHVFEAAQQAGVKNIVYMSSITVINGDPKRPFYPPDVPIKPNSVYGVTKLFGEQLGEMYARQNDMCVTCLRLGQPLPMNALQFGTERVNDSIDCGIYVGYIDIAHAIDVALRQREPGWRKFNVVSHCRNKVFDLTEGESLGFLPTQKITVDGFVDVPAVDARSAR
jgi:uronate dehydrogenase